MVAEIKTRPGTPRVCKSSVIESQRTDLDGSAPDRFLRVFKGERQLFIGVGEFVSDVVKPQRATCLHRQRTNKQNPTGYKDPPDPDAA
jgi:hypothetical protein